MLVYCRTTYRYFYGRVIRTLNPDSFLGFDRYLIKNFKDGLEYPVAVPCMERIAFSGAALRFLLKTGMEVLI